MKKITFLLLTLFTISAHCFSQIAGNAAVYDRDNSRNPSDEVDLSLDNPSYSFSTLLEANVMINVKASAFVAIFSLSQNGKTIEETETLMRNRIDLFKQYLQQAGVDPKMAFTDPVTLVPTYEIEVESKRFSKTFNEVPSGFEIKKNVHIEFKNHEQINDLLAAAAKAEIYDLVKVDYIVNDMNAVLDQLREEALKILASKKELIKRTGMNLRFSQVREKYGSVYPMERYSEYYAYKTGVTPTYISNYRKGQQTQYNYAEKNKSVYYDRVSYKQFDKVINPVVGEPQVQIYLTLKGQYTVYDEEEEKVQKAHAGKMRELQIKEMELKLKEKERDIELKGKATVKVVKK
jgi:uncharacterized protein YggE